MGLSICKKIIQKLGNNINCESENNITQFKFSVYDYCNDRNILQTRESLKTIDDEETLLIKYESNKKNEIINN